MKLEKLVLDFIRKYNIIPDRSSVICGLSGGADSVALCRILHELQSELHLRLIAAHVHHGIRGTQADEDEKFSRAFAESLKMEFHCVHFNVPMLASKQGIGIEECARQLRYGFFIQLAQSIGAGIIATAHQSDDALETALFHFTRGSGIRGLSGIQPVRSLGNVNLVRPLICITRKQIEEYLAEAGADYRVDETNACDDYARNQIRHHVVPALEKVNSSLVHTSIQTLKTLRMEADFLEEQAQKAYSEIVSENSIQIPDLLSLHPALQGRVIEKIYKNIAGANTPQFSCVHSETILTLCMHNRASGTVDLPADVCARRIYEKLILEKSMPVSQEYECIPLIPGGSVEVFGAWRITLTQVSMPVGQYKSIHNFFVDCSKIYGKLLVRKRIHGDKIHLAGHEFRTSLKKLMIDRKIPRNERETWPVITDAHGIIAVAQFGIDARVALDTDSHELYSIRIEKL